ncbi:prephenate dehydrogenase/arogenate dehydrogenase family protein [Actinokineospora auranticolor]|uniref:Prephenate dehydrogenase n=1 Tax=Actinokineospora auranticolor TaxID=155976 RepID=A0A2S6GKB4_9PSEU|nr:prephenate dehydrogenase dimerization domain-containing protein [Actinokineospora auranticolor]PPK65668.1 prephenate dehydrogenase [Actinokineospora auranticolor]
MTPLNGLAAAVADWRCLVVGGAGAVGGLFVDLLAGTGARVVRVDTAPGPDRITGDITAPDDALAAEVAAADAVLLAVPEPVALAALEWVAAALSPGALLVDTLSVKSGYAAATADLRSDVELLGLNPMFAPALGFAGRPVAAVAPRGGPRGAALLGLVEAAGARVVPVTAERHDRLAAASQALTHAAVLSFGAALAELGVTADELATIAPPPHATLLALLARIAGGTPEVYWDVQAANPHAAAARTALAAGARAVDTAVAKGEDAFTDLLADARAVLGSRLPEYGAHCARLFDLPRPSGP